MRALEAGSKTIHVNAAVDIWAIGVIAFELLTGERVFPPAAVSSSGSDAAVKAALLGRTLLPWEGASDAAKGRQEKLRGLRRTVLKCLARDPTARPTSDTLLQSWEHAFDNMQSRGSTLSTASG